jgi:hypothetical protein
VAALNADLNLLLCRIHLKDAENMWCGDQAIMERLNTLRAQQLPAVDAACRRLEGVLQADPYLQQRLCRVTVEAHSKALYSLHKCALFPLDRMYGTCVSMPAVSHGQ